MELWKYHGLGNDYLVLGARAAPLEPALAEALCDRHRGLGGDGVLAAVTGWGGADYGVRILNPDGSEAEKSGNGLRIFARWLVEHRGAPRAFSVATLGGVVKCRVFEDGDVEVEMGRATLAEVAGFVGVPAAAVYAVDVGNPHCVLWMDQAVDGLDWRAWGARIERDPRWPNRSNVQFARALGPRRLEARIWERGAGETLASGSSACAVAASAVARGICERGAIEVVMEGGVLGWRWGRATR